MAKGSSSPYGWQCLRCGALGQNPENPCTVCTGTIFECVAIADGGIDRARPRWAERIAQLRRPGQN